MPTGGGARANHYHKEFTEILCIIRGTLRLKLYLPENPEAQQELTLNPGEEITILPPLAHSFVSNDGAVLLEYSPDNLNLSDAFEAKFNW